VNPAVAPPGWHGKLPSLGDFASRRLDAAFIEAWDGWLAAGLLALRESDPEGWLDAYLASPSWRFLLMPGVLPGEPGRQGWAGVLMPSVDRVGRYFPFTLVQPLGSGPATTAQMGALWHWLGRLDELAVDALQDDWPVDRLEDELARMAPPALADEQAAALPPWPAAGAIEAVPLPEGGHAAGAIGREAQALWAAQAAGRAYWFAQSDVAGRRLLVSRGLPAAVGALLGVTI
jgi:type VI secretion system protein ImpM